MSVRSRPQAAGELHSRAGPDDPAFPACQQFLHLGEAGLAASIYFVVGARNIAPEAERHNWSAGQAQQVFDSRLGLVTQQLARSPYLAGETFTAADISVTYALALAKRGYLRIPQGQTTIVPADSRAAWNLLSVPPVVLLRMTEMERAASSPHPDSFQPQPAVRKRHESSPSSRYTPWLVLTKGAKLAPLIKLRNGTRVPLR